MGFPADKFVQGVKKELGEGFTCKWGKVSTDIYRITIIANVTGQKWQQEWYYDDFSALNPQKVAHMAFEKLEADMHEFVNKTTTAV